MPKERYKGIQYISARHRRRLVSGAIALSENVSQAPPAQDVVPSTSQLSTAAENQSQNEYLHVEADHTSDSSNNTDEDIHISDEDTVLPAEEASVILDQLNVQSNTTVDILNEKDLSEQLKEIATSDSNMTHKLLSRLLVTLKRHSCFKDLPKDSRTLLETPKTYNIRAVPPGSYFHFGIVSGILHTIKTSNVPVHMIPNLLQLQVNVDGLPIAKSSGSQFWPILGSVNIVNSHPFIIGAYHGFTKPNCSNDLLQDFIEESNRVLDEGVEFNGKRLLVEISAFTCDVPARAFIKKIKGHNGYYGCDKCITKGVHLEGRMAFPEDNKCLRTDEDFACKRFQTHHVGVTNLEQIKDIKMVTNFPNDYMHSICLGVTRKLIKQWMKGKLTVRLSNNMINRISAKLLMMRCFVTSDFARKPRSLKEIDRWKATELRQFLLYTGPFVLKSILPKKYYTHFLSLSCAIRILCSPTLVETKLQVAHDMLLYFFLHFKTLYGIEQTSFNVHSVIHLANDVSHFGPLDLFSAFKFENFLKNVKSKLKNCSKPLPQLIRRVMEERSVNIAHEPYKSTSFVKGVHTDGPLVDGTGNPQFKKFTSPEITFSLSEGNNCVQLKDGTICVVENIATSQGKHVIIGKAFLTQANNASTTQAHFFKKPIASCDVGIFKLSNLSERGTWNLSDVAHKAINFPMDDKYNYVAVLLHH